MVNDEDKYTAWAEYCKKIADELFDKHSLAALVILINIGDELEFHYKDIPYSITWLNNKVFLSSPKVELGQTYDKITELIIHGTIDGKKIIDVWDELVLKLLYKKHIVE